jgi:hypothetical protein
VDGSLPGLVERRHLIDRVFEKPPAPPGAERLLFAPDPRAVEAVTVARRGKKAMRQRVVSLDAGVKEPAATTTGEIVTGTSPREGEDYRRRLEALREEAGSGWLRVLSESPNLMETSHIDTV